MKNKYIYIITCLTILFSACAEDKVKSYEPVDFKIKLNIGNYDGELEKPLSVKFTSLSGVVGVERTIEVSSTKEVIIKSLIPGRYMISVAGNLSEADSKNIFNTESELMLKGGESNIRVFDYTENSLQEINMEVSTTSSLVFKELYYAVLKNGSGSYLFEQFFEIYNNSDEVVYLDSLCISNIYPHSGVPDTFGTDDNGVDLDANFFFGIVTWMIPGTGKDVPLEPGKSVVLCSSGRNHKDVNENLLDLSSSDYEAYVNKISGLEPLDYPVPNLVPAFWTQGAKVYQWTCTVTGPGMVIYKLDYPFDANDTATSINKKAVCIKIPKSSVLDAVECLKNPSVADQKRFPSSFDAGFATVLESNNGKSIARKILQTTADGRIIFQDTNNSSEDFEVMDRAMIRRYLNK